MTESNLYNVGFEDGFKEAQGRIKELEAKLAKAVEAFHCWCNMMDNPAYDLGEMVAEFDDIVFNTLAELTRDDDD